MRTGPTELFRARALPEGLAVIAVLFGLLWAPPARGQTSEQEKKKAKKWYQKGLETFHRGEYSEAITYFKRANSITEDGVLLYNISTAYSKLGVPEKARSYGRRAREVGGLPEDTESKLRARMAGYGVALEARRLVERDGGTDAEDRVATESREMSAPSDEGDRRAESGRSHALGWIGGSVAAAGLGATGGALLLGQRAGANIESKRRAEQEGDLDRAQELYQRAGRQQSVGRILLFSGLSATALGGTLLTIDLARSGNEAPRARLTPLMSAEGNFGMVVGVAY